MAVNGCCNSRYQIIPNRTNLKPCRRINRIGICRVPRVEYFDLDIVARLQHVGDCKPTIAQGYCRNPIGTRCQIKTAKQRSRGTTMRSRLDAGFIIVVNNDESAIGQCDDDGFFVVVGGRAAVNTA